MDFHAKMIRILRHNRMTLRTLILSCIAALPAVFAGCARHEISIIEPSEYATVLGREETAIEREPVEYRFNDLQGRLGVRIINHNDEPITVLGERSYVVDPYGQTRPMRGGTIAPRSFIAFSIPPVSTVYRQRSGFTFGVGAGRFSRGHHYYGGGFGTGWGDPWDYATVETVRDWSWQTGDVRLRLVYEADGEPIEHEFTFLRERIK